MDGLLYKQQRKAYLISSNEMPFIVATIYVIALDIDVCVYRCLYVYIDMYTWIDLRIDIHMYICVYTRGSTVCNCSKKKNAYSTTVGPSHHTLSSHTLITHCDERRIVGETRSHYRQSVACTSTLQHTATHKCWGGH